MKMLTTDPKKAENENFFFVNDMITKKGIFERQFADKLIELADNYQIIILQIKPTQGLALFLKIRGYGLNMFNLNKAIRSELKTKV